MGGGRGEHYGKEENFSLSQHPPAPPRPAQHPPPPVRMAATTADTFPRVGRMGLPIFVGLRGMAVPELAGHVKTYRQAWREAGHPGDGDVGLRIPGYAAPTASAAPEEPKETILDYLTPP